MILPRLLLLTDRSQLRLGRGLVTTIRECVEAGASAVVVRELDLAEPQRAALVHELGSMDGLTVISARTQLPGATGVHLAAAQPGCVGWHGRSCHSTQDVHQAVVEGAAYAMLSPFTASPSKPGHGPAIGRDAFAVEAGIPVFALGGIDPRNARQARDSGAYGVCVMGAVMRAPEPADVVHELLQAVGG